MLMMPVWQSTPWYDFLELIDWRQVLSACFSCRFNRYPLGPGWKGIPIDIRVCLKEVISP